MHYRIDITYTTSNNDDDVDDEKTAQLGYNVNKD